MLDHSYIYQLRSTLHKFDLAPQFSKSPTSTKNYLAFHNVDITKSRQPVQQSQLRWLLNFKEDVACCTEKTPDILISYLVGTHQKYQWVTDLESQIMRIILVLLFFVKLIWNGACFSTKDSQYGLQLIFMSLIQFIPTPRISLDVLLNLEKVKADIIKTFSQHS